MDIAHPTRPPRTAPAGTVVPTDDDVAALDALVARHGLRGAVRVSGLPREAIDRIRGGLPCRRASLLAARLVLRQLADGPREPRP
jgi:hypothetical protein